MLVSMTWMRKFRDEVLRKAREPFEVGGFRGYMSDMEIAANLDRTIMRIREFLDNPVVEVSDAAASECSAVVEALSRGPLLCITWCYPTVSEDTKDVFIDVWFEYTWREPVDSVVVLIIGFDREHVFKFTADLVLCDNPESGSPPVIYFPMWGLISSLEPTRPTNVIYCTKDTVFLDLNGLEVGIGSYIACYNVTSKFLASMIMCIGGM